MNIGVPREIHRHEHRVGLTPFGVSRLVKQGHSVLVERQAGESAHFTDRDFEAAGARTVYTAEEVYKRSEIVCRVGALSKEELDLPRPGSTICAFQHLAVAPLETVRRLMDMKLTLVGYELIRDARGDKPVLWPMSDMAGQMAVHIAAHYLQAAQGGRGILMGNVPGVPPPTVLILGAGAVGHAAARQANAIGAHVIVLDIDVEKLQGLHRELGGHVVTSLPVAGRLSDYTAIADVLIGGVLIPGDRAPFLVTEEMVRNMKKGSVIVDVSIDQGGCIETSRPTSIERPVFVEHDVVHYCVPNMTANIPRTASRALATVALSYVVNMANKGVDQALRDDEGLAAGVLLWRGELVNEAAGKAQEIPATPLSRLLGKEGAP